MAAPDASVPPAAPLVAPPAARRFAWLGDRGLAGLFVSPALLLLIFLSIFPQFIDPELGIDVIDLGLVYGIEIDELGRAIITMTLTTPACPLTDLIEDECASTLAGLVEEFRIDWTWQPRWTMDKITPEGRDQLAALGFNFDNLPKY